jgi:hypothetical protein
VDEARHFARLFFIDKIQRVEALHFGGERHRITRGVKLRDGSHPAFACQQVLPSLGRGIAHRADQPNSGNDDAPLQNYLPPFAFFSM